MVKQLLSFMCLFTALFFCPINSVNAADPLEGTYSVRGWNLGINTTTESYIGTLTIQKSGQVYRLNWTIANQRHAGVGFYDVDSEKLAVAWANLDTGDFGEVVYALDGKTLNGIWAMYGDETASVGREILAKQE